MHWGDFTAAVVYSVNFGQECDIFDKVTAGMWTASALLTIPEGIFFPHSLWIQLKRICLLILRGSG